MKKKELEYSEKDVSTTTNVVKAVTRVVEEKLRRLLRKRNILLTDEIVDNLIDEEWKAVKRSIIYWQGIRWAQQQLSQAYELTDKILNLTRNDPIEGIKDTLNVSSFRKEEDIAREKEL